MLSSINPLVERAKHNRFGVTASAHIVGATVGGAAFGALLGGIGSLIGLVAPLGDEGRAVLALTIVVAVVALDLHVLGLQVPTTKRQVDEDWLGRYRGWVYGAGFGLQLGLGVVTIVTTAAVYGAFALGLVAGSPPAGAIVGAVFGFVRGAAVLTVAHVRTAEALRAFHQRLARLAPRAARAVIAANAALAFVCGGALIR
jgi:hypothetical protein